MKRYKLEIQIYTRTHFTEVGYKAPVVILVHLPLLGTPLDTSRYSTLLILKQPYSFTMIKVHPKQIRTFFETLENSTNKAAGKMCYKATANL